MKFFKGLIIDRTIYVVLALCVLTTLVTTATVIGILGKESLEFFAQVPVFDFLFGTRWAPLLEPKSFGVLPLVAGTLMIVVGSIAIALPMGLLVAIYLSEYASSKTRAIIKPILEVLAGIPTIVYGFFALTFVTPSLKILYPDIEVFNAISGAIVVGIMILPMISSLCDDALQALPTSLREGAYALGGFRFEVVTEVILPAVSGRIGAAVVLAVSRAIGETMAVTLAAGATPNLSMNPMESIQTITAYIVQVSLGDTPAGGVEYLTSFAVGALLFVLTLVMNIIGNSLLTRVDKDIQ